MTRKQRYGIIVVALIFWGVNLIVASLINGRTTLKPNEIVHLSSLIQAIEAGTYSNEFDNELEDLGIERIERKDNDVWFVETKNKGKIIFFDNAKSEDYILIEASFYKLAKNELKNYALYVLGFVIIYVGCDIIWSYQKKKCKKNGNEQPETSHTKKESMPGTKTESTLGKSESKKQEKQENKKNDEERKKKEDEVKHPEELIIKRL